MSESDSTLNRFVDRTGSLYSLPAVAMEVLQLTNNPKVDAKALKNCIENDPALTTKILRVVNSSLFGLSREVSDLNQALALLGTKPLKLLVLGFSLPERLFAGVAGEILGHYWRRTLTKAIAARELCDAHWKQGGDEAFIAGLLGDVGVLVLLKDLGEPYARFLQKVVDENGNLAALETEALGFDHTELSAQLLQRWGLPNSLSDAISAPKSLDQLRRLQGPAARLPQLLHLAELLAQLVGERRIGALPDLLEAAKCYRGITRLQITDLVEQLGEKVSQLAEVLSLELPHQREYNEVLSEAHARLSEVAEAAALMVALHGSGETTFCEQMLQETQELSAAAQAVARAPLPEPVAPTAIAASLPGAAARHSSASKGAGIGTKQSDRSVSFRKDAGEATPSPVSGLTTAEAGLLSKLNGALTTCRQSRCELSLLLIEADRWEPSQVTASEDQSRKVSVVLETACLLLDHGGKITVHLSPSRRAIILPDCDRKQAALLGGELVRVVRQLAERQSATSEATFTASVGAATVATPRKNFPPQDLIEAADRCLYGGHVSGGNTMKSIEIY